MQRLFRCENMPHFMQRTLQAAQHSSGRAWSVVGTSEGLFSVMSVIILAKTMNSKLVKVKKRICAHTKSWHQFLDSFPIKGIFPNEPGLKRSEKRPKNSQNFSSTSWTNLIHILRTKFNIRYFINLNQTK